SVEGINSTYSKNKNDYNFLNDIAIIGDKIIIASNKKGLGIFEVKDEYFDYVYRLDHVEKTTLSSKINYTPYENENIIRLTVIPNTNKVVLTIESPEGKIRNEIIEV